ncbi:MAG: PmoA family protein [Bacteroidales bacterium]
MTRFSILLSVALLVHACSGGSNEIEIVQTEDELTITDEGRPVLTYRISEMMPTEGVDPLYRRSGFIHPLQSPGGEVLTQIQPRDHYHHYGIWGPWTRTRIGDRQIDYWNLAKGEGTVRMKAILTSSSGQDHAAFTALQSHIDFGHEDGERVTMDEFYEVRYLGMEKEVPRYMVDITSTFRNVIEDTIIFEAHRYGGGLGFRATERWNANSCTVVTSEGKVRDEADGTTGRWCIIEGQSSVEQGRSGILFMSHPANREHPEPMRVWPTDMPKGGLMFNFTPTRYTAWEIVPGIDYTLRYRLVVFDGSLTTEEADAYWSEFASSDLAELPE